MKTRQLKKLLERVNEKGLKELPSECESAANTCATDCTRMEESKKSRRIDYQNKIMAWKGEAIDTVQRPNEISGDHQDARIIQFFAWGGLLLEVLLAVWVFIASLGLAWPIGAVIAILTAFFFQVLIFVLFRNVEIPKQTLRKIKNYVLYPSLVIFLPSFAILLLSRTITGQLSLILLPFYGFALWLTTIGLLPIVGSLFAIAYVLDWSYRDAKEYAMIDKEHAETLNYKKLFEERVQQFSSYLNTQKRKIDSFEFNPNEKKGEM